jgi:hypothetical protein
MSFRPDSPLNRLVLLWPGVPIAACAVGFSLALLEVSRTGSHAYAALAIAMGCGLALSIGLLFHFLFVVWVEVIVSEKGLGLRPVGMGWFRAEPSWIAWSRITNASDVVTHQGGYLRIATVERVVRLDRVLFTPETYGAISSALSRRSNSSSALDLDSGLAAAA